MSKVIKDFLIGADPEFVCTDKKGYHIYAEGFIQNNGPIGSDDAGHLFEVRPDASEEPLEIVGNIQLAFKQQSMNMPTFLDLEWISGSYSNGFPLGGHIHFGIKRHIVSRESLISFLDQYLGSVSLLIENREEGLCRRRTSARYGKMGDYRPQDHGFEYRVVSSWLVSPYIAAAILCLGKTIIFEAINNFKFKWNEYVKSDDFFLMKTNNVRTKFPQIWRDITKMLLYQKYKPYIDLIYFLVNKELTWFPQTSMKNAWGVVNLGSYVNEMINLDVIWLKYHKQNKEKV